MTQGAPVLAGMTNTASQTTTINMEGSFVGLSVVTTHRMLGQPTQSGPQFKRAARSGGRGCLRHGRRRGVYAVGLDGEGVWAYSWSSDAVKGDHSCIIIGGSCWTAYR